METVLVSLFAGIGGFDIAARNLGIDSVVCCEIDPFCQAVLRHHFPGAYIHGDIKTLTGIKIHEEIEKRRGPNWRQTTNVIVCGGFPCQPYSNAGRRKGKSDDRHLWPEMLRIIRECAPDAVVGENVPGIISWGRGMVFEEVHTDLEGEGFAVQSVIIPACGVGAPHKRDRIWIVAVSNKFRADQSRFGENRSPAIDGKSKTQKWEWLWNAVIRNGQTRTNTDSHRRLRRRIFIEVKEGRTCQGNKPVKGIPDSNESNPPGFGLRRQSNGNREAGQPYQKSAANYWDDFPTEWPFRSGDDGLSSRLDHERIREATGITRKNFNPSPLIHNRTIKAAGNAIVPQVAEQVFKALLRTWQH